MSGYKMIQKNVLLNLFILGILSLAGEGLLWAQSTEDFMSGQLAADQSWTESTRSARNVVREQSGVFDEEVVEKADVADVTQVTPAQVTSKVPTILVHKFIVDGGESLPYEQVLELLWEYEGKNLTLVQLHAVAKEITDLYAAEGYITSYAYVPEQDVTNGEVKINIVEGIVGEVHTSGNDFFDDHIFKRDIERRLSGRVLRFDQLQKIIRQLDSHPDRQVKAFLKPGHRENETDIVIQVVDNDPKTALVEVNNSGTVNTGRERYGVGFRHSNVLGQDDQAVVKTTWGEGMSAVSGVYMYPIYDSRTHVGVGFSYVATDVGGEFEDFQVESRSKQGQVFLQRDLWANQNTDVSGRVGVVRKDWESKSVNRSKSNEELLVVQTDLNVDRRDAQGRTLVNAGVDVGVPDTWGSARQGSSQLFRDDTDVDFLKFRGSVDRYQKVPIEHAFAHARVKSQFSSDRLPVQEQFSLTGMNNVRGFSEGAFLGDNGVIVSAELFSAIPFIPNFKYPFSDKTFKESVHIMGFVDYGVGSLNDEAPGTHRKDEFASVGLGLRARLYEDTFARLEVGFPVNESNQEFWDDAHLHFVVQTEFF